MAIISDAFRSTFTSRKKDGESLQEYKRLFKTSKEILEYHMEGSVNLGKIRIDRGRLQRNLSKQNKNDGQTIFGKSD